MCSHHTFLNTPLIKGTFNEHHFGGLPGVLFESKKKTGFDIKTAP
jgi:hypothetical protein